MLSRNQPITQLAELGRSIPSRASALPMTGPFKYVMGAVAQLDPASIRDLASTYARVVHKPWTDYSMAEWVWAQLRAGFQRGPVSQVPVVDHPDCANGTVSRRRWFTWQQANAVTIFEIELLRDIVAVLARDGIEPVNSWITQHTRASAIGGHRAFLDASGTANGVYLTSYIGLARGTLDLDYLHQHVVPTLATKYPFTPSQARRSFNLHTGPYGFGLGVRAPEQRVSNIEQNLDRLVITSPTYYCRYYSYHGQWPGTSNSSRWPLAPADERTPILYPKTNHRNGFTRNTVENAAPAAIAKITDWAAFLGIDIGELSTPNWQSTPDGDRYLITAPVTFNNDLDTMWQLAQPYTQLDIARTPATTHRLKQPLVRIHTHSPVFGEITDHNGTHQLAIRSHEVPLAQPSETSLAWRKLKRNLHNPPPPIT